MITVMDNIRNAHLDDAGKIRELLEQLGYLHTVEFIRTKLACLLGDNSYRVFVYEIDEIVVSFITLHFSVQIAYEGEFTTIGFFVVDENVRSKGVGKAMEEYCTNLAKQRGCALMELYSNEKRVDAHRFYERQGYQSYKKYFMKML